MTEAAYLREQSGRAAERLRAAVQAHPAVAATGAVACGVLVVALARVIGRRALWRTARPTIRRAAGALASGLQAYWSK